MHALIIEDDDLIAMTIEEVLRKCGFTSFHFAVSLDEAVAAARERCPRLITADVELKPGSGIHNRSRQGEVCPSGGRPQTEPETASDGDLRD